ncbi:hypothetical protein D6777_04765, partial [Candidatus Woesearchaeota archaeon]
MAKKQLRHIKLGIGTSFNEDPYKAAIEASNAAIEDCGYMPMFSLVYVDSRYDPKKILKGVNSVLGSNWMGCSVDTLLNSQKGFMDNGITVVSIYTEHLKFSVAAVENYRKNPVKAGETAVSKAMAKINVDQYADPYVQFKRAQNKSYKDIVRNPPYFILMFCSGAKYV